jgi:cyanophycin synthetase
MRGPNYWSVRRHKLIVMVFDLEEMEERPSNKIRRIYDSVKSHVSLLCLAHRCSVGTEGGFFERVEEGTWMGHIVEHIALEIQSLAGMEVGFGSTRDYGKRGVYSVVFAYMEEKVGRFAAEAAVRICQALDRQKRNMI